MKKLFQFSALIILLAMNSWANICIGEKDCPSGVGKARCEVPVPPGGFCVVDPNTGADYIHCLSYYPDGTAYDQDTDTCGEIWDFDDDGTIISNINDPFYYLYCDPFAY